MHAAAGAGARRVGGPTPSVVGTAAVAAAVPFRLRAPASLVGLPRQGVRLIDGSGTPGAMVVYGHGLGAIVVIEQGADATRRRPAGRAAARLDQRRLGHELATALGTAIQFDRGGVRYTLVGSLPAAAAEAAARALALMRVGIPDRPVEARGLVKRYGDLAAVDGVDLTVEAGDVYGYLGPNGAGKTTSLRMLLGLIRPTGRRRPAVRPRSDQRGPARAGRGGRVRRGARASTRT